MEKTVCYCIGVTEDTIVSAIHGGARTLEAVQEATGACTGNRCRELNPKGRCCSEDILELIRRETGTSSSSKCSCCR